MKQVTPTVIISWLLNSVYDSQILKISSFTADVFENDISVWIFGGKKRWKWIDQIENGKVGKNWITFTYVNFWNCSVRALVEFLPKIFYDNNPQAEKSAR